MHTPQRLITLLLVVAALAAAQPLVAQDGGKRMDRQEWFNQMRVYKHDFLTKELELSSEQQEQFFPLYDEMNEAIMKAQHDSRQLERKINRSASAVSDSEYEAATEAVIAARAREVELAREYYAKFKGILTPQQIYKLTQAERQFTREVMKQHSRMRQQK